MFKDIDEAIAWITSKRNENYSFAHFQQVCALKGDPQDDLYVIHVAGTDGKGSTVNYLAALLESQGLKVGTFTSPHYLKHQDRIRINGENIPDQVFLKILNEEHSFFVEHDLSMFEMDFLIMCRFFKEEQVDLAIIETGLGGRLDSTNVVHDTRLSIITTIGFDHMDRLGNTLPDICREKCGIIKEDSKVLIGHLDDECREIVRTVCSQRHSKLYELGEVKKVRDRTFIYDGHEYMIRSYALYQLHNASLALKAFDIACADLQIAIDREKARNGLKNTLWHGRFEIVREDPKIILDGAHNIHGIKALMDSFDELSGSKCIIFSALKRKEYPKMIAMLEDHCDKLLITTFAYPGAIGPAEAEGHFFDPDLHHAIDEASASYENILICGSLYFLSEVVLEHKF